MARNPKTPDLNILGKTSPQKTGKSESWAEGEPDMSDLDSGLVSPVGIGLTQGERDALDKLAEENEVTRHSLLKLATRLFIRDVRSGRINIGDYFDEPPPPKKQLKTRRKK